MSGEKEYLELAKALFPIISNINDGEFSEYRKMKLDFKVKKIENGYSLIGFGLFFDFNDGVN